MRTASSPRPRLVGGLLAVQLMSASALAAAPAFIVGPNSYRRLTGVVTHVQRVQREIGTSDTTSEQRPFREVILRVATAETVELIETDGEGVVREVPKPEPKAKDTLEVFYFEENAAIAVGDELKVETRTRRGVSYGWTGPAFGAAWSRIERDQLK